MIAPRCERCSHPSKIPRLRGVTAMAHGGSCRARFTCIWMTAILLAEPAPEEGVCWCSCGGGMELRALAQALSTPPVPGRRSRRLPCWTRQVPLLGSGCARPFARAISTMHRDGPFDAAHLPSHAALSERRVHACGAQPTARLLPRAPFVAAHQAGRKLWTCALAVALRCVRACVGVPSGAGGEDAHDG